MAGTLLFFLYPPITSEARAFIQDKHTTAVNIISKFILLTKKYRFNILCVTIKLREYFMANIQLLNAIIEKIEQENKYLYHDILKEDLQKYIS